MKLAQVLCAALLAATPAVGDDLVSFDISSFGSVVLKRDQMAGDAVPEAAFGAYNNEFISAYAPSSVFARMGRAVGRLDVATDAGVFPCTAFLVDEDLLMTNHHCVPGITENTRTGATAIVGVQFVAGYLQEGITEGAETFLVNPVPVETNKALDYTLLRIIGARPGRSYGMLALAGDSPDDNTPFWIIGHPMGEAQRISREKCRANAPAFSEDRLLHTCDTMPGNSGSPVIDAGSQRVIALHHAGSARNSVNYAVPMSAILRASTVLKPAATTRPARSEPDRNAEAAGALIELLALQDRDALESGLARLVADFPGTPAARTARLRLDTLDRERERADRRDRHDRANETLLAALMLTDPNTQRAALEKLLQDFPDSPAAAAGKATLEGLRASPPQAPPATATPEAIYPVGTPLRVESMRIRARPSEDAPIISQSHGIVRVGEHVSGRWYRTVHNAARYFLLPAEARPLLGSLENAPGTYAQGTVIQIGTRPVYRQPSSYSTTVGRVNGKITVSRHIAGDWYTIRGSETRYVKLPPGLTILQR